MNGRRQNINDTASGRSHPNDEASRTASWAEEYLKRQRSTRKQATPTPHGEFLMRQLRAQGKTQRELAEQLHRSPATISRLFFDDAGITSKMLTQEIVDPLNLDEKSKRGFFNLKNIPIASTTVLTSDAINDSLAIHIGITEEPLKRRRKYGYPQSHLYNIGDSCQPCCYLACS
jgi:transcriptional regulator with XRE-family HTH domain